MNSPRNAQHRQRVALLIAVLALPSLAVAEIYKWVDANGRTHFSERPDDAGRAQVVDTKPVTAARAADPATQSEYWQERERQFRQRQVDKQAVKPPAPAETKPPKSLSGGRAGDTDESRCRLARDILNGSVRHSNGKPTDAYDRDVAASDVRAFCH
jgi:hypothetical protein